MIKSILHARGCRPIYCMEYIPCYVENKLKKNVHLSTTPRRSTQKLHVRAVKRRHVLKCVDP